MKFSNTEHQTGCFTFGYVNLAVATNTFDTGTESSHLSYHALSQEFKTLIDLLFDKINRVEFIVVALPLSTNTIKHDTEKINKCVAVSRAKTNLETKEHQLSWQWGAVSYSS